MPGRGTSKRSIKRPKITVDLFPLLFDPVRYAYNPYALPHLVGAVVTLAFGITIAVRERASREGVLYFFQTIAIGTWLLCAGMALLSRDVSLAEWWIRVCHVGVAFIPAITLQFAFAVVRPGRLHWALGVAWAGAILFAAASLFLPGFFGSPYQYSWGYYVRYTWYSTALMIFIIAAITLANMLYWQSYKRSFPNSSGARRAKLLFTAFCIGGVAAIDFLPAYGVPTFPTGLIPMLFSIGVVSHVTSHYRLVDITPAFAAKQIIETMNDGLFVLDSEGVVRVANQPLVELVGLPRQALIGSRVPTQWRRLLSRGELRALAAGIPMQNREINFTRPDGSELVLSIGISVMPQRDSQAAAYVGVVRDITEQKRNEERIRQLAYYDNLTGLPNRQMFQERLRRSLAEAARRRHSVALLFLDLDHFKRINDTLGHALGDELLQAVAGRLLTCVRKAREGGKYEEDTVARLGGDEFIVALHGLEGAEDAARVAERILAAVSTPLRLSQHEITVTSSLGISLYPTDGEDAGTLLKNADAAMYQAKEAGRNSYFFYDRRTNAVMYDRLSLETKLRKALDQDRLLLHYQPVVTIGSRQAVSAEALLRWYDSDIGWIPPERFVPIAEESGLILSLGDWVLRKACLQAAEWQRRGLPSLRVAVNLSGRQIRDRDFLAMVHAALEHAYLDPHLLELELTESMVMQEALHTVRTFEALKAMGVKLSVDDFGTGYSSLSYLRSFPVNTLKIDRSFVQEIHTKPDSRPIVAAIVAMAKSLGLGVVGEGVETEEQSAFLQSQGCKYAQGFLFCEPLSSDELETWLRAPGVRASAR